VVGASPRSFIGQVGLQNCRRLGFAGRLFPVTPTHPEVDGLMAYPSIRHLDAVPDLALVQISADKIGEIIEQGLELGIRGFVIPGAGYTDSGEAALTLTSHLSELRTRYNFEVIGPNCMGVVDLVTGAAPYVGTVPSSVRRGGVGVVAQSGAIVEALVNAGGRVPFSTVVSSGSEATTSMADILDFFVTDEHTSAVLAFIETVTHPNEMIAAVRKLSEAGKQLAVCIVGRSQAACDGIAAHSGKLASGARVTSAALQQAGAIIAEDLDELITLGELLGADRPLPTGPRTHIVTNSGGEANMITDIIEDVGLELPTIQSATVEALIDQWPSFHVRNPLDPWGTDSYPAIYPTVIEKAAEEPGDIIIVSIDQQRTSGDFERQLVLDLARYLDAATQDSKKFPVLLSPTSQDPDPAVEDFCRSRQIPIVRGARTSLSAIAKLTAPRSALREVEPSVSEAVILGDVGAEDRALSALNELGVRVPRVIRASTVEEVLIAAEQINGPVALKGSAPGVIHKTELGLVRIGLSDPTIIRSEAARMISWAHDTGTELELIVAEMINGSLELIVGYKRDPVFGPTVIVGLGGVWTEFFDSVAVHVGPVDRVAAEQLIMTSRIGAMLEKARGGSLHVDGVIKALCAVSDLGTSNPDVLSIDINPLIVGPDHATAVDAVIERNQTRQLVASIQKEQ
jgi:acyl-CoA synthetase (NDP forming)